MPLALILPRRDQCYLLRKPLMRRDKGDTLSLLVCVCVFSTFIYRSGLNQTQQYTRLPFGTRFAGQDVVFYNHLCINSSSLCPGRRRCGRRYWCLRNPDHLIHRCYYRLQSPPPPRRLCHRRITQESLKKNLNVSRPSEHPPVRGGKCQNVLVRS